MPNTVDARRILLDFAELGILLERAFVESAQDLRADPELLSNGAIDVLLRLDLDGPMRPGHIGEITGLSSGGVTKLLGRLEAEDLLSRHYGEIPDDARGVEVRITSKGRRVASQIAQAFTDHRSQVETFIKEIGRALEA